MDFAATRSVILVAVLVLVLPSLVSAQAVTLRAGDRVEVVIRGVPHNLAVEIAGPHLIDRNGRLVGLPHLDPGGLLAAGLTEEQLATRIAKAYRDAEIFPQARVTVLVDDPALSRVAIGGHVTRPGPVEYFEGMTAFDAYTEAGGAARFGQIRRVFLFRDGQEGRTLDMTNNDDKRVHLLPGDTLEIDRKTWREP